LQKRGKISLSSNTVFFSKKRYLITKINNLLCLYIDVINSSGVLQEAQNVKILAVDTIDKKY